MADMKKVIKGLEETEIMLMQAINRDDGMAVMGACGCLKRVSDALALLKEQKSVKAVADGEDSYRCNNCGTVIGWAECETGGIEEVKYKFCPECGRTVKWNE